MMTPNALYSNFLKRTARTHVPLVVWSTLFWRLSQDVCPCGHLSPSLIAFSPRACVCAEVCAFRMPRRVLNYATAPRAYERESRAHMKAALDEQSRMHDANASLAKQDAAQLERTARAHAQHVERIVSEREELRKMQVGRRICQKQKKSSERCRLVADFARQKMRLHRDSLGTFARSIPEPHRTPTPH